MAISRPVQHLEGCATGEVRGKTLSGLPKGCVCCRGTIRNGLSPTADKRTLTAIWRHYYVLVTMLNELTGHSLSSSSVWCLHSITGNNCLIIVAAVYVCVCVQDHTALCVCQCRTRSSGKKEPIESNITNMVNCGTLDTHGERVEYTGQAPIMLVEEHIIIMQQLFIAHVRTHCTSS